MDSCGRRNLRILRRQNARLIYPQDGVHNQLVSLLEYNGQYIVQSREHSVEGSADSPVGGPAAVDAIGGGGRSEQRRGAACGNLQGQSIRERLRGDLVKLAQRVRV